MFHNIQLLLIDEKTIIKNEDLSSLNHSSNKSFAIVTSKTKTKLANAQEQHSKKFFLKIVPTSN